MKGRVSIREGRRFSQSCFSSKRGAPVWPSTVKVDGAAAGNVEGLRWCTVSLGGAQNGFVGVRGSYGRGQSGNRAVVCSNCSSEEQWLWRLGFVAFPVGLRARKKKGASRG